MRSLITKVQNCAVQQSRASCSRSFLNNTTSDPVCQAIVSDMNKINADMIGCTSESDPYYFDGPLNRVTIDGATEDYRLVLFFIKKGTTMPLHDHPNMSVFFRLMFGELKYHGYDKVDEKYKYNDMSSDEYWEMIANKNSILAKRSR